MKKFSVVLSKLEYTTVEVEAESIDEAVDKVMESDTTEFDELDWRLAEDTPYEVEQVDELDVPPEFYVAEVKLKMQMDPDESMEEAENRLYDLLYEHLVRNKPNDETVDFDITNGWIEEEE